MQNGLISLATVLMLAVTGCGHLGGVCEEDCDPNAGSAGSEGVTGSGGTAAVTPGVVPADVTPIPAGQRVIGYLPTWGASLSSYATPAILSRLTHVAIAFANVTPTAVSFANGNDVRSFVSEARKFNVKVLVSLGGANGSDAVAELITPANLPTFVANTMKCVEEYGLDGVDVDIEGGAVNQDYEPLVQALSNELKPRGLILSSAVGNWFADRITPTALGLFDFVQVMAYDACGSWTDACPHSSMELARGRVDLIRDEIPDHHAAVLLADLDLALDRGDAVVAVLCAVAVDPVRLPGVGEQLQDLAVRHDVGGVRAP